MAVYGKEQLKSTINAEISDNVTGEISPRDVRHNLIDIIDSISTIITTDNISTLNFSTPPTRNTRVGELSLDSYISSVDNTAIGYQALTQSYTSVRNTALGVDTMHCHMTGQNNTAIGYRSLYSNTTGSGNVALGAYALRDNVWGSGNVAIGDGAGCYEKGNYRLYIANHSVGPSCDSSTPAPLIYGEFENVRVGIGTRELSGYGMLEVAGNITPSQNCQFSLGANTRRWTDLYLCGDINASSGSGINIITGDGCGFTLNADGDFLPTCSGVQDIGASGLRWNDGYYNGIRYSNSLRFGDENGDNWSKIDNNGLCLQASGLNRWCLHRNNDPEVGSNYGSNLELNRYNDAGSLLGTELFIFRPSGYIGINTKTPSCNLDVVGSVCIDGKLNVIGPITYTTRVDCIHDCVTLYLASSGMCGDGGYPCAIGDEEFIASGGFILRSSGTDGIARDKEFVYNPSTFDVQKVGCGHPKEYWTSNINLEVEPGKQIRTDSVQGHQHLFVSNSGCHGLYLKDDDTTGLGTQQPKTKFNIVSDGGDSVIRNTSLGSDVTVSLELLARFNDTSDGDFEGFDVKYIDDSDSERFAVGSYHGSNTPINAFVIMRNPALAGFAGITNLSENPLPASIFNIQATGDAIVRVFAKHNSSGQADVSSLQLLGTSNTPTDGLEIEYSEDNERADFNIYNNSTTKTQAITIKKSNQYVGIGTTNPTERLTIASRIAMKEDTTPSTTDGFGKLYCKSDGKVYFLNDEGTEYDLTSASVGGGGGSVITAVSGVNWDDYENTWGGRETFSSHVSSSALGNTLYGDETGTAITAGDYNTLIGANAGKAITGGENNTFVGYDAGVLSTGSNNVFLGRDAGVSNTGSSNVFIGRSAGSLEDVGNASSTFVLSTQDNVLASGSFSTQDFYLTGPLHTPYNGSKKDIISGGTRTQSVGYPDGDGFRIRGDGNFFGTGLDALIIEKTAGTQNDPDGGIAFINTGNDGTEETALVIRGDNKVGIGTKVPTEQLMVEGSIKLSGSESCLVFNDGTSICTAPTGGGGGGGGGTGDITRVNITAGDGLDGSVDTLTGDHTQTLSAKVSDLVYGGITHDGSNNFKLNSSLAGDGLQFTQDNSAGQILGVDVSDFAGDGLSDDGSENLILDIDDLSTQATSISTSDLIAISQGGDTKKATVGVLQVAVGAAVPVGTMVAFGSAVIPDGWLLCDGQVVSRTEFADLFDVIGTTYGNPGSTTFNVPDLQQRYPRGAGEEARGNHVALGDIAPDVGGSGRTFTENDERYIFGNNLPEHDHALPSALCQRVSIEAHDAMEVESGADLDHTTGTYGLVSGIAGFPDYGTDGQCDTEGLNTASWVALPTIDPFLGVSWIIKY